MVANDAMSQDRSPTAPTADLERRHARRIARIALRRRPWNQWAFDPDPETVATLESQLYFEGERRVAAASRFFMLLALATLLAGFGLYANSLAVVVAAMLIETLMMPIMGFALALVCGNPGRQLRSAIFITAASTMVVFLGWVLGQLLPSTGPPSHEVLEQTNPQLIDLAIALVAGLAGAYALARREAAAALPGVAIGVSLVPPLTTTGMLIARGERALAAQSVELFLLNLAAVVLAGSVVFVLLGFLPVRKLGRLPARIRIGLLLAAVATVLVAIPLIPASRAVLELAREQDAVGQALSRWEADQPDIEVMGFTLTGDRLVVNLTGPSMPDGVISLRVDLQRAVNRAVAVDVRFYQYTQLITTRGRDR